MSPNLQDRPGGVGRGQGTQQELGDRIMDFGLLRLKEIRGLEVSEWVCALGRRETLIKLGF